jgi:oligopeptide transport system permease protein
MGNYLFKRLAQVPVVLLVLVTIAFFMMRAAPGGPFAGDKKIDPEILKKMEEKYHLDKSPAVQYAYYVGLPHYHKDANGVHLDSEGHRIDKAGYRLDPQGQRLVGADGKPLSPGDEPSLVAHGLLQGDLGPSFKNKTRTVNEILADKFVVSAYLGLLATIVALVFGLAAGVVAGIRQNSNFDYSSMAVAMAGLSIPTFVVGPILALIFGRYMQALPVAGYEGLMRPSYLVLPVITLALPFAARIARLTRAGMLEVINQDYIRTAWAKGLTEKVIVMRHAMRGAMLPVVSFLGPAIAAMLTGSIVVEKIFFIPGVGSEFVNSAFNRDYTLALGTVILYGVLLVLLNLVVDLVYGYLDPRIRYA